MRTQLTFQYFTASCSCVITPLPPEGPSPGWACHSKESRFTPVKRTVQPPLAVTIWLPETFNWGGEAKENEAEERKPNTINTMTHTVLLKRTPSSLKRFFFFTTKNNSTKDFHPFKDSFDLKAVLLG